MKILNNKRGSGYITTGIKILVAVVIGAVLLGGFFLIFQGDNGVFNTTKNKVEEFMEYKQETKMRTVLDEEKNVMVVEYSLDGENWCSPIMPSFSATSNVVGMAQNDDQSVIAILIKEESTYHVLTSIDQGFTFTEKISFEAKSITHFTFCESSSLPSCCSSFEGKKFVCRYKKGSSYYTMVSDGNTWTKPSWSDLIMM